MTQLVVYWTLNQQPVAAVPLPPARQQQQNDTTTRTSYLVQLYSAHTSHHIYGLFDVCEM